MPGACHDNVLVSFGAWYTYQNHVFAILVRIVPANRRADASFVESLDLALSFESWRRLRKDPEAFSGSRAAGA
jgi:hypothetical protein